MRFANYNTLKLDAAPAQGVNPPVGHIFEWITTSGTTIVIHRRNSDGIDESSAAPYATNALLNGGFDFFQRQAPGTLTDVHDDVYGPDRWNILTQTDSIQICRVASLERAPGAYISKNTLSTKQVQSTAQRYGVMQIIESVNSVPLQGKRVTFELIGQASVATNMRMAIIEWQGTADAVTSDIVNDWTSTTYEDSNFFIATVYTAAVSASLSCGTDATNLSVTATISPGCNNLIVFIWTESAVAQNVVIELSQAGVYQIDVGTFGDWKPRPTAQELALCQRYYEKSYSTDTAPGTTGTNAYNCGPASAAVFFTVWLTSGGTTYYKVTKRTAATPTLYNPNAGTTAAIGEYDSGGTYQASRSAQTVNLGDSSFTVMGGAGDFTTARMFRWHWTCDAEL